MKRVFQPWTGDAGVAFTPDGSRVVTSGTIPGGVDGVPSSVGFAGIIKVFRVSDGALLRAIRFYEGGGQQVRAFALSAEGNYAAVSLYSDQLRIYRLADGALVQKYDVETADVNGIAFTPDGGGLAYVRADGFVIMARNPVAPAVPYVVAEAPLVPIPVAAPPDAPPPVAGPQALTELRVEPEAVAGGKSAGGSINLAGPAPAGGQVVSLSATSSAVRLPASVTVPAGADSYSFIVTTSAVADTREGLIRASATVGEPRETGFKVLPF